MSASGLGFTEKSFDLLEALSKDENNNKEWYDEHREEVQEKLLSPFAAMLEAATTKLNESGIGLKGGENTMFRMNRDVRFSKDKRPYKDSVSGMLTPSGTKAEKAGVVYLELAADGGWIGGGFYKLPTDDLNRIRDKIIEHPDAFAKVLGDIHKRDLDFERIDPLKSMPRGYSAHDDHPHVDYLKLRNLLLRTDLPKKAWLDDSVVDRLVEHAEACTGVIEFGQP
jgi:uncharacterized protein (TIGR02453 family)